ncbi:MFS general substrate transporter [Atractiella rhizophila]|nr:MFS general substrate transporter [Atractiella rhizophila]
MPGSVKSADEFSPSSLEKDLSPSLSHDEKSQTTHGGENKFQSLDAAAAILGEGLDKPREISEEESKRVLRKIDTWLLPPMLAVYFLQQLDKSALSFSAVFGIQADAHLHGQQYSWLGSIVYFAQLVFQPLSSYALVRFPPGKWLSANFLGWGIVLACMASAKSFGGLATARFFLGACEATVAPTFVTLTAMFWRRREQPLRTALWYSMNGLVNILGSLLSYGLGHIHSDTLHPYQIIFLFCGCLTVALALPLVLVMPDSPSGAKFLTHEEKIVAIERVRANNTGTETKEWKWAQCREAFLDVKTWLWFSLIFCISTVSGGITTFGPLILKGFGYNPFQTILHNMIPGAIQMCSSIIAALVVQYTHRKGPVLFTLCLFPLAGAGALYALPRGAEHRNSLLAAYYVLSVYVAISPVVYVWSSSNTAGHTKKLTTTGILFVGQSVGNIVGPQLYHANEAPEYHRGLTANLILLAILTGLTVLTFFYLIFLNKLHERKRVSLGKSAKVVDLSLVSDSKMRELMEKQKRLDEAEGKTGVHNSNAFLDMTDLQNEDFLYSL